MKRLCYILAICVMFIGTAAQARTNFSFDYENEKFIDNVGFDWQYGKDYFLPDSMKGKHSRNTVNRWSFRAETRKVFSHNWGIFGELHYSAHKADEKPDYAQDTGFKEIGLNLGIKYYWFHDLFYTGFFAGLAYVDEFPNFENRDWADRDLESNIGRSHCLGSWGGIVGKDWWLNQKWALRTEARLTHTSDPFRTDMGKNFGAVVFGLTYKWQ